MADAKDYSWYVDDRTPVETSNPRWQDEPGDFQAFASSTEPVDVPDPAHTAAVEAIRQAQAHDTSRRAEMDAAMARSYPSEEAREAALSEIRSRHRA